MFAPAPLRYHQVVGDLVGTDSNINSTKSECAARQEQIDVQSLFAPNEMTMCDVACFKPWKPTTPVM